MRSAAGLIVLILISACSDARPVVPDARTSLARGRTAASAWQHAGQADTVDASTAIALGYMERLRLGLGSPFRLIDYAIRDPRLSDELRMRVGWALLARTIDGDAYEIDPAALDRGGAGTLASSPGLGRRHLELIDATVSDAEDPRSGELAVRIGYALAATEGSLPTHAPRYATQAAALLRDRELARRDAADLLHSADSASVDALVLLQEWRRMRRFRVESPMLAPLAPEEEKRALAAAPQLAEELRELAQERRPLIDGRAAPALRASLLGPAAAAQLLALAKAQPAPPVAPLVIGVRGHHTELVSQPWLTADERARRRALEEAGSEEMFAARYAQLERTSPHDVVPSLVAMWGAVGMRSLAQQRVWYPGYPSPSNRELLQRYGLESVTFSKSVPETLRPYYRHMLDIALVDLKRALPTLDVRGLAVQFQDANADAGTLAMHDPKRRRLLLPTATAAGTLAHEIAHDLDWQVALRRYRVRGDYASDRAMRNSWTGDRLALRMQDLAVGSTSAKPAASERVAAHAKRPAEILARNIDWFVASALAAEGRTDGYLTSVQDELLTGYGTVREPELSGVAAEALMNILDEIAPVDPDMRGQFLHRYGSGRTLRSYDLVRRVVEAPIPAAVRGSARGNADDMRAFTAISAARALGDEAVDIWACRAPSGAHNDELERARRELVAHAAAARARGYAVKRAGELIGGAAAQWVSGQLYGAPWGVDGVSPEMQEYLQALVDGARSVDVERNMVAPEGFKLATLPTRCIAGSVLGR